jgi:hypothetical protein
MDKRAIIDALRKAGIEAKEYQDDFLEGVICNTVDGDKIRSVVGNEYKLISSVSQILVVAK